MISRRRLLAAAGGLLTMGAAACVRAPVPVAPRPAARQDPPRPARASSEDRTAALAGVLEGAERSEALGAAAEAIRSGLPYDEVVSALALAAVRQIRPRPYLGPMFHAVMMMPAIDEAGRRRAGRARWVPVLWAVDLFKELQARYREEGGAPLGPPPRPARDADPAARLAAALEAWDEAAADEAATSLHERGSKEQAFAVLFRYAARDYRDIGHKSIYVAGAWRLLQRMPWRRASPLLRSVALALLRHEGSTPPANPKLDGTWARNQELAARMVGDAPGAKPEATRELLAVFRRASDEDACHAAMDALQRGAGAQSVWDAIACGAAELVLNRPASLLALHAVTTTDALAHAWQSAADVRTRRLILLHAVGRLVAFRDYSAEKDGPAETSDAIDAAPPAAGAAAPQDVLAAPGRAASLLALGYLERGGDPGRLLSAVHDLVVAKADDPHDYKLGEAVTEQLRWISPPFRARFLAASLAHLPRSTTPPSPRVEQVEALLSGRG